MTEQLALTGSPVEILADGRTLTDRQKLVYDWVREVVGGVTADEIGALLHHRKGKHNPDERCKWCTNEGESALRTKALAPLLIRRRGGKWQLRNAADHASASKPLREPTEAELAANPFSGLGVTSNDLEAGS